MISIFSYNVLGLGSQQEVKIHLTFKALFDLLHFVSFVCGSIGNPVFEIKFEKSLKNQRYNTTNYAQAS